MPYYTRVLSKSAECVPLDDLAIEDYEGVELELEEGTDEDWQLINVQVNGQFLFAAERWLVTPGSDAEVELDEMREEIAECFPVSARNWLLDYLPSVKSIYAFQHGGAMADEDDASILYEVMYEILHQFGGIIQADGEGFTNEQGYYILWQFSDEVVGQSKMAVLENGTWNCFQIDLGNQQHRKAFQEGTVPDGAQRIDPA